MIHSQIFNIGDPTIDLTAVEFSKKHAYACRGRRVRAQNYTGRDTKAWAQDLANTFLRKAWK